MTSATKNAVRNEKFRKIGAAISHFVADPQVGICAPHPWKVRKSEGFDVLQIATDPTRSKLEMRSEAECIEQS